jgi:hypothetical protein
MALQMSAGQYNQLKRMALQQQGRGTANPVQRAPAQTVMEVGERLRSGIRGYELPFTRQMMDLWTCKLINFYSAVERAAHLPRLSWALPAT